MPPSPLQRPRLALSRVLAVGLVLLGACNGNDSKIIQLYPSIAIAPDVLSFGDTPVDYSTGLDLTVINSGQVDGNLSNFAIEAPFSIVGDPETVVPKNGQINIPLQFLPTTYQEYAGAISIDTDDPDHGTVTATLTGTGVYAPTPSICVDPLALDFGAVVPGSVPEGFFVISNCGDGALDITSMTQAGSGAFVVTGDPTGFSLASGQDSNIIVQYAPTTSQGDSGSLTITSNDPVTPTTTVTFIGNGGGTDFNYPIADIVCPTDVAPRDTVTLDGRGSSDPAGNVPLTYSWTLIQVPDGSQAPLTFPTSDVAYLATDIAGDYAVQLQVTNSIGVSSAPTTCAFTAVPKENLHVELTWSTPAADVDLHLLTSAGQFFVMPYDCNYCNQAPDWGVIGATDDPSLDIDDRGGYGPENINIDDPADDTYSIMVHYYTDNGDGDLTATVKVYLYGVLAGEASSAMKRDQVWNAGQIKWPDGLYVEQSDAPYTAPRRTCE